jgi:hypothetical protein
MSHFTAAEIAYLQSQRLSAMFRIHARRIASIGIEGSENIRLNARSIP